VLLVYYTLTQEAPSVSFDSNANRITWHVS